MILEFLGLSPMGSAGPPALDGRKDEVCARAGRLAWSCWSAASHRAPPDPRGVRERYRRRRGDRRLDQPRPPLARDSPRGRDPPRHRRLRSRKQPHPDHRDLKPGGRYTAVDVDRAGGSRLLGKRLLDAGLIDGTQLTTTGRTIAEEVEDAEEAPGQDVIVSVEEPLRPSGGLVILKGNLAPEGCVVKVAGYTRLEHTGPARVFDSEEDAMNAVQDGDITENDVVVIRYEGPKGGPGMREMLGVTAALVGQGLGETVALLPTAASPARPAA